MLDLADSLCARVGLLLAEDEGPALSALKHQRVIMSDSWNHRVVVYRSAVPAPPGRHSKCLDSIQNARSIDKDTGII